VETDTFATTAIGVDLVTVKVPKSNIRRQGLPSFLNKRITPRLLMPTRIANVLAVTALPCHISGLHWIAAHHRGRLTSDPLAFTIRYIACVAPSPRHKVHQVIVLPALAHNHNVSVAQESPVANPNIAIASA
jgi:hypothetical protein